MLLSGELVPNQINLITFVLSDNTNAEVDGLVDTFDVFISKGTGPFLPGLGSKGEKGLGWYWYEMTPAECDTIGPVDVVVTGAGTVQQNLEYVCGSRTPLAIEFSYTLTSTSTGLPIEDAQVWFSTDPPGANIVWAGRTDIFGVARDQNGRLPRFDPGTYYIYRFKQGYSFVDPDVEVVS